MAEAYINRIVTAVPPHERHAHFVARLSQLVADPVSRQKCEALARNLGIAKRYVVCPELLGLDDVATDRPQNPPHSLTTAERMCLYREYAPRLLSLVLKPLFRKTDPGQITHVVFASCTGFYAPGPDIELLQAFGLRQNIARTLIGFMGCYAAVPALRVAREAVLANPASVVLVVCLELCSLHWRAQAPLDQLLTHLLFADGCGAAIVSAETTGLRLGRFDSRIIPDTSKQMEWAIGDDGFFMTLSPAVAKSVAGFLKAEQSRIWDEVPSNDTRLWAVHPGGRAILDAVENALELPPEALAFSRGVLRDFGNMSSATLLFILERLLASSVAGPGIAMAFGPGLSLESFRFEHAGGGE